MPNHIAPFAVQPGEGKMLETPTGDVVTIKATTRQTNGSLTVLELLFGPKQGPALHTHVREDELWYVIEGAPGSRPHAEWERAAAMLSWC